MLAFPGLFSWAALVMAFVSPFLFPTSYMVFSSLFVFFTIATMLPSALYLPSAVWAISQRRDSRHTERNGTARSSVNRPPYHAFVVPNYKESPETLRATLRALSAHPSARTHYIVVLAMEGREAGSDAKARALEAEYADAFLHMSYSMHRAGVEGECDGKASNATAAGRHLLSEVTGPSLSSSLSPSSLQASSSLSLSSSSASGSLSLRGVRLEEVLVTVMDADTLIDVDYIDALERKVEGGSKGNLDWHRTLFIPYMRFSNTEDDATVPDITRM
jgi:cellulose synthase/poly-beta-1,6-N-acetylglucosamine synthase-like glycosyltransferase